MQPVIILGKFPGEFPQNKNNLNNGVEEKHARYWVDYLDVDNNVPVFVVSDGAGVKGTKQHENKIIKHIFWFSWSF